MFLGSWGVLGLLPCHTLSMVLLLACSFSNRPPMIEAPPSPLSLRFAETKAMAPPGFTVLMTPPFVLAGDEDAATVRDYATSLIYPVVAALKVDYFPRDPDQVFQIWLFKDATSYQQNALRLFGDTPDTPYGYTSEDHRAMVMNIATGGGTLTHEMVHPYMASNFPDVPSWFNEGLASLYEAPSLVDGHLLGRVNWRLRGLKKEILAGTLPDFPTFLAQDSHQFYRSKVGDNYAQARYLCLWLQVHDQLHRFYQQFHDHVDTDPTGIQTLTGLTGDLAAFQRQWQAWVMTLEEGQ